MTNSLFFKVNKEPWNKGKIIGQKPPLKLKEIWAIRIRLQLAGEIRNLALFNVFSRCMVCNHTLETVAEATVRDALPAGLRGQFEQVSQCPGCRRLYWPGSHYDRLVDLVTNLLSVYDA